MDNKMMETLFNHICQDASYKFGDLIMSYPVGLRALAMATVQACITANLGTMPQEERKLFEAARDKMVVMTIPTELDPRKYGGQKNED